MKKSILILGAAVALVGCNKESGGTSDTYGTDRGSSSTPAIPTTRMTNATGVASDINGTNSATSSASDISTNLNNSTNRPGNP